MEEKKSNKGVIVVLILIIILLLLALGYSLFGKELLNKTEDNTTTTTTTTTKVETNTTEVKQITVRTYRFFGYDMDSGPDMYTTLKLYSNNKYEFYVNNCSEILQYSGDYTETSDFINLKGDVNYKFDKRDNGNSLDFKGANVEICHDSGGGFLLESYALGFIGE